MKRGGTADIFLNLLSRIRATIPGVAIRTSMIVGFPGETDRDFEELCQFIEAAQFDRLGVFSYSDEETSGSYALDGKVDNRTIYNRKRKLMAIQRCISAKRNKRLVGSQFPVLVDGPSSQTELLWEARCSTQAPEIDGVCYINDFGAGEARTGEIRRFQVTEAHDHDLIGTLVDGPERAFKPLQSVNPFPILKSHPAQTYSVRQ
jgi:ribosomal protein S12 methylthiotransferase